VAVWTVCWYLACDRAPTTSWSSMPRTVLLFWVEPSVPTTLTSSLTSLVCPCFASLYSFILAICCFVYLCQRSAAVYIMFSSCSCVCPCVVNVANTISWKVLDIYSPGFQHWCICDKDERIKFGSRGQSLRSRWSPTCWKMHFVALLMRYFEITGLNFTKPLALILFGRHRLHVLKLLGAAMVIATS